MIELRKIPIAFQAAAKLFLSFAAALLVALILVLSPALGTNSAGALVPVDRFEFEQSNLKSINDIILAVLFSFEQFSEETTPPAYVLTAQNFVLHIDDYDELDDGAILERASAHAENLNDPYEYINPVVIENALYPAVGAYKLTLGFNEQLFSQEPTPTPRVDIYAFVVDDNTLLDEGVVLWATGFEIAYSERSELTTQTVKQKAYASAFYIEAGSNISCEITVDELELAEFVQSSCLEPAYLTLSVPATLTPASAVYLEEEGVSTGETVGPEEYSELTFVSKVIQVTILDDRPQTPQIPQPPQQPQPPQPPQQPQLPPQRPQTPPRPPHQTPNQPQIPPIGDGGNDVGGSDTGNQGDDNNAGGGSNTDNNNNAGNNNNTTGGNNNAGNDGGGNTANGGSGDDAVLGDTHGASLGGIRPPARNRIASNVRPATTTPATEQATSAEQNAAGAEDGDETGEAENATDYEPLTLSTAQATDESNEAVPLPIVADTDNYGEDSSEGNNFILIAGIVLAIVALGVAAYLGYQQFFKEKSEAVA